MLSKSQARMFFLTATLGFSGVFLFLTADSLSQVPARSHEDALDARVVRGKQIWDENNCMGCHTLLGEGAYYAPELTKVVARRGAPWLTRFLADPQAMYPGERKMTDYDLSDADIEATIAFLDWIGKIDTNGFPADPDLAPPVTASAAVGRPPATFTQVCMGCHKLGGQGGAVGPALDGVGRRFTDATLRAWLDDPQSVKPGTAMPDLGLTPADTDAVVQFLLLQN